MYLLVLIGMITNSCTKTDHLDCLKGTGSDITESRDVSSFNKIVLNDNVNLVITQDTNISIQVTAGEKLIGKVGTDISNNVLSITNNNTCNWVRSFDREIIVYVGINNLNQIEYRGSGDITSTNEIKSDSLLLQIWEGAGTIDLQVNTQRNYIYFHIGTADVFYSGKTHLSYVSAASFGPIDARNLKSTYTYIGNSGSNNCFVGADLALEASISSIGNIYYFGNPQITLSNTGQGELIKYE